MTQSEVKVVEYERKDGKRPFGRWFDKLNIHAQAKIDVCVERMKEGNFSGMKSVGSGVYENKVDFGPGYRVYFGKEGNRLIILLGGGTKKSQSRDIEMAKQLWVEYKSRKGEEDIRWH